MIGWQELATACVVVCAVGFLVWKLFLSSRKRRPSRKPDVALDALTKKVR